MDIREKLSSHAQEVAARLSKAQSSERSTELLLVEPFIKEVLGYRLDEITPRPKISFASTTVECDYAIELEGEQVVLIECKRAGVQLSKPDQLGTYLERKATPKIGIYTDGVKYHVYATHIEDNIKHMDTKPLLSFDFRQKDALPSVAEGVRFLTKDSFSPVDLREWARRHESALAVREALRKELADPSEEIIRLLADRAGIGNLNNGDIELLKTAVRQAVNQPPPQNNADTPTLSKTDSALKRCSRCGKDKERSEFYRYKNNPDGLDRWCKECCRAYDKYRREQKKIAQP